MAQETTYHAYWQAVASYAQEAMEASGGDPDLALEHAETAVDGSWWVIYTHAALAVLQHTSSDDAIFDVLGYDALKGVSSCAELYSRIAFFAMRQDVFEALSQGE